MKEAGWQPAAGCQRPTKLPLAHAAGCDVLRLGDAADTGADSLAEGFSDLREE
jgi:hypothetical protein